MTFSGKNRFVIGALAAALLAVPVCAQNGETEEPNIQTSLRNADASDRPPAGPFTRLANGKPDFQGFWDVSVATAAFDIEPREVGTFAIPAGPGIVLEPKDGQIPYQPWAEAHYEDMNKNHRFEDPQAHCYLSGVPRQHYTPFGFQLMQGDDQIIFSYEAFHAYRIIYMSGEHPDPVIKLFEGDSRGHWEGDTLVVDVANLNDRTWFDMEANFHTDQLHVVERYTPIDENTIRYRAVLTDPGAFTEPMTVGFDFLRNPDPDYENLEYACVEGEQDLQHYTLEEGGQAQN